MCDFVIILFTRKLSKIFKKRIKLIEINNIYKFIYIILDINFIYIIKNISNNKKDKI